jgi:hypothetical protein
VDGVWRSGRTDYGSDVTGAICGDMRRRLLAGSYSRHS